MALDFRDQYFGCEIEMTGLTRQQAARTLAELFGTSITHYGGTYDGYRVADREGKDWKIVSDQKHKCGDYQLFFHGYEQCFRNMHECS